MSFKQKIINDPVYGFITINNPLIFSIIANPFYQRLRRIHQMALAYLVYPGAVHTRLHHSLGAYHLMTIALNELKQKGVEISPDEYVAAQSAILLHDVGHSPFSHALEEVVLPGFHHEELSLKIMQKMNTEFEGKLQLAIDIFTNNYPKKFLYQLVSGQLDVDRMDYLTRDSFFTGVTEGVIGYDRILKMLIVKDNELMVEEKGIYSIEKFLVARRQMYWQVYLHKTVLAAEKMLVNILKRVRELIQLGDNSLITTTGLDYFLFKERIEINDEVLKKFRVLDDIDVSFSIKKWSENEDIILSNLCSMLLNRRLLKAKIMSEPVDEEVVKIKMKEAAVALNIDLSLAHYFVFTGETSNTLYKSNNEKINIAFKNGDVKDISSIDDPLIHKTVSMPVKRFYICYL
jgi:uncharacterized protein